MKAIEYVYKYGERLGSSESKVREKAARELFIEMLDEVNDKIKTRRYTNDEVFLILKEQNKKWNTIANVMNILKPDGFALVWTENFPAYIEKIL